MAAPRAASDAAGLLDVVRDLGCLQLDPISAVAPNHQIVLWSRAGHYDLADFDTLMWQERSLFEYWAHAASIVLTEDYPIHHWRMRHYTDDDVSPDGSWSRRMTRWVADNAAFRDYLLAELRAKGPLRSKALEDRTITPWPRGGWTTGRHVSQMLDFLWSQGQVMIAGRSGRTRIWDLAERCLPDWTPRELLPAHEVTRRAAQKAIRALGVGTARHIKAHFTRGIYPGLPDVLAELESEGRIARIQIEGGGQDGKRRADWYIHTGDLALLERLLDGEWQPRTTLLSPFDNLICDRKRTETLFDYSFRTEIYTPKAKRRYGYYVLSILHGDRIIGRLDPKMDRKQKRLVINAVYAEPGAPSTRAAAQAIADAIGELARFLGAQTIDYGEHILDGARILNGARILDGARIPDSWRAVLRAAA